VPVKEITKPGPTVPESHSAAHSPHRSGNVHCSAAMDERKRRIIAANFNLRLKRHGNGPT
jgi:hypothetical protein